MAMVDYAIWILVTILVWLAIFHTLLIAIKEYRSRSDNSLYNIFLVVIVTGLTVFTTSYEALNMSISPDSLEYSLLGRNLHQNFSVHFNLDGALYPSRYAPWFSWIFLAPAYLFTQNLGAGIWIIVLLSIVCSLSIFLITTNLLNAKIGWLAIFLCLLLPEFRYYSGQITADIPITTLSLLLLIHFQCYFKETTSSRLGLSSFFILGTIICLTKPTGWIWLTPFIFTPFFRKSTPKIIATLSLLSIFLVFVLTTGYNISIFKDPLITGYHFWLPIPYLFFFETFNYSFVSSNLSLLLLHPLVQFAVLIIIFVFVREGVFGKNSLGLKTNWQPLVIYGCAALLLCILHLFYFYSSTRFFLPVFMMLILFVSLIVFPYLSIIQDRKLTPILICCCFLLGGCYQVFHKKNTANIALIQSIVRDVPDGSILITTINPLYLQELTSSKNYRIIPFSREVEYASKSILPLTGRSSLKVFKLTAIENSALINKLDSSKLYLVGDPPENLLEAAFASHFRIVKAQPGISELLPL